MAVSFSEGAGPGDAHAPPLMQFLALDMFSSWAFEPKQPHWRHPELRRALASDDQADELRRIRASVQDSVVKAMEKVRSLHEDIQKLDKYKNIVTRKGQEGQKDPHMAGSFSEGAGPGDAHSPPLLSQFLALDVLPSWSSVLKQPHWRHPELRRALASDDRADDLRRIRASVQDSVGEAKEKVRSLHEDIQKLNKYKNIVTRKRQRATDDAGICDKLNNSRVAPEIMSLGLWKKITKNLSEFSSCDTLESTSQHGSSGPRNVPLVYLRNITNNFSDDRLLGEGGFGTVYKGVLPNGETVAVKKLHSSMMPGVKDKQFENEAYHLMRLKHPNILLLVGCCSETEETYVEYNGKHICAEKFERLLCLEYMPKGNLRTHLSDESSGLPWETRYKIIEGICYGLHYLHEGWQLNAPIVHLDLKPANILLDSNMVPKIADFGLSRLFNKEKTWTCTISRDGTLGYMAPEYMSRGFISTNSDIFSLGVIIIEIVTGKKDYPDESWTTVSSQEFTDLVLKKWRQRYTSLEIDYQQQIVRCIQIGLDCVKLDRLKRPTIGQVIKMLHETERADLVSTCKDKLAYFRIKELKDILNQLGLPKQGKRQNLVDRILAILSDEQGQRHHGWGRRNALTREAVAKVVDDTYRKMQACPTVLYHVETKV